MKQAKEHISPISSETKIVIFSLFVNFVYRQQK